MASKTGASTTTKTTKAAEPKPAEKSTKETAAAAKEKPDPKAAEPKAAEPKATEAKAPAEEKKPDAAAEGDGEKPAKKARRKPARHGRPRKHPKKNPDGTVPEKKPRPPKKPKDKTEKKKPPRELKQLLLGRPKNWEQTLPTIKKGEVPQTPERSKIATRRFSFSTVQLASKPMNVERGEGVKLKTLEHVSTEINCRHGSDTTLGILHRVLFGHLAPSGTQCKKDLLKFSGVSIPEGEDKKKVVKKYKKKLEDMRMTTLRDMCRVFNIDDAGEKPEVLKRLLSFLMKPKDSGLTPPVREKGRKSTGKSPRKSKATKKKPASKKIKRPTSGFFFYSAEVRPAVMKKHPNDAISKIAQRIGKKWRHMSDSEKKPYNKLAEKDKARYAREVAEYEAASSSDSPSESGSESDTKAKSKDKRKHKHKHKHSSDEEKAKSEEEGEKSKEAEETKETPSEPDNKKRRTDDTKKV